MKNETVLFLPALGLTVGSLVAAAGFLGEVACSSAQGKAASKEVVVYGGRLAGSSFLFLFLIAGIDAFCEVFIWNF